MFAPLGYEDLKGIISRLNQQIAESGELFFPSLDRLSVEHLGWLAWRYGELDFIEQAVIELALQGGLFVCSLDGRIMCLSANPLEQTSASAIEIFENEDNDMSLLIRERIAVQVPSKKNMKYPEGHDPWAYHREASYRTVPLVFSRADYIVSLRNLRVYQARLNDAGHTRLASFPVNPLAPAEGWGNFEGWSLCISREQASEFSIENIRNVAQHKVVSAVWDNADEMYEELFGSNAGKTGVTGKINQETRALKQAQKILSDESYEFRTLKTLRSEIDVTLGERAWRRVVEALRLEFPDISKPGRKS